MSSKNIIESLRNAALRSPCATMYAERNLGDGFTLRVRPIFRGGRVRSPFDATNKVAWFIVDDAREGERRITRREAEGFAAFCG